MFQITTTDGEQQDSLDYQDGTPEMSPPPVGPNTKSQGVETHSQSQNPDLPYPSSAYAGVNHSVSTTNLQNVKNVTGCSSGSLGTTSSVPTTNHTEKSSKSTDSPKAPPPTPLVGSHQESKFTFVSGRTPPLPDLRVTDFFR